MEYQATYFIQPAAFTCMPIVPISHHVLIPNTWYYHEQSMYSYNKPSCADVMPVYYPQNFGIWTPNSYPIVFSPLFIAIPIPSLLLPTEVYIEHSMTPAEEPYNGDQNQQSQAIDENPCTCSACNGMEIILEGSHEFPHFKFLQDLEYSWGIDSCECEYCAATIASDSEFSFELDCTLIPSDCSWFESFGKHELLMHIV